MADGTEFEMGPGDLFDIGPGHDSLVVGDEPYVSLHFLGASEYGGRRPLGVEADPERVERPEEHRAPALVAVGAVELAADRVDRDRPEGSGGIGIGGLATIRSRRRSSSGRSRRSRTTPAAQRLAPTPSPV